MKYDLGPTFHPELFALVLLVAVIVRCNATSRPNVSGTQDDVSDDQEEEDGGSRSVGGAAKPEPWSPSSKYPPWLMSLMLISDKVPNDDGYFIGFGIRLNSRYYLGYNPAQLKLMDSYNKLEEWKISKKFTGSFLFHAPETLDNTKTTDSGDDYLPEHVLTIRGPNMGIYQIVKRTPRIIREVEERHPLSESPRLESKMNANDSCFLYSYSASPGQHQVISSQGNFRKTTRTLTTMPVRLAWCRDTFCQFNVDENLPSYGMLCQNTGETCAPVICGKDKRLAYLALPITGTAKQCSLSFEAFQIASRKALIEKAASGNPI